MCVRHSVWWRRDEIKQLFLRYSNACSVNERSLKGGLNNYCLVNTGCVRLEEYLWLGGRPHRAPPPRAAPRRRAAGVVPAGARFGSMLSTAAKVLSDSKTQNIVPMF